MSFSRLIVEYIKPRKWRLYVKFIHVTRYGVKLEAPRGFYTNFASVPRILHSIFSPTGPYARAAVLHDFLWGLLQKAELEGIEMHLTFRDADRMFRDAMEESNVSEYVTRGFYWIVIASRKMGRQIVDLPDVNVLEYAHIKYKPDVLDDIV